MPISLDRRRLGRYLRLSDLQIIFLFFLEGNNLRKAHIPFIGVSFSSPEW
jgi:hypothetical protein